MIDPLLLADIDSASLTWPNWTPHALHPRRDFDYVDVVMARFTAARLIDARRAPDPQLLEAELWHLLHTFGASAGRSRAKSREWPVDQVNVLEAAVRYIAAQRGPVDALWWLAGRNLVDHTNAPVSLIAREGVDGAGPWVLATAHWFAHLPTRSATRNALRGLREHASEWQVDSGEEDE